MEATLQQLQEAGATLHWKKCEFHKAETKFLGHIVSKDGISADPEKTRTLVEMDAPTNITELWTFIGMANQMGKFSPMLAELSQPLRELLSSKRQWISDQGHEDAFAKVKEELSKSTLLYSSV